MTPTRYTNYALRTLMRCDNVAKAHNLSRSYIVKGARTFGKVDYLQTGRVGGLLSRKVHKAKEAFMPMLGYLAHAGVSANRGQWPGRNPPLAFPVINKDPQ